MQHNSGLINHTYQNVKLDECHICLDPLIGELAEVSCGHIYHLKCLVDWIKKKGAHRACCICSQNTEIINIIMFPPPVNNFNCKPPENINNQINNVTYQLLPENKIKKYKCCQIL